MACNIGETDLDKTVSELYCSVNSGAVRQSTSHET